MTVFDLDERQGVWFELEGGGRVQLRTLTPGDWVNIRKATVKREAFVEKVDGKPMVFERQIIDEEKQMLMINDCSIVSWEGLFDKNNNPIPCTTENKRRLMLMRDDTFRDFVNDKLKLLSEAEADKSEGSEKN